MGRIAADQILHRAGGRVDAEAIADADVLEGLVRPLLHLIAGQREGAAERSHGSRRAASSRPALDTPNPQTKKLTAGAWEEARALVWKHRYRLALGLFVMIINRLVSLVLPATSKFLMDDVIGRLCEPLA